MPYGADFEVIGPIAVKCVSKGYGRIVDKTCLKAFWTELGPELAEGRGCYVFGMRAGKGITPVYVGKATKSFRQECFTLDKLNKTSAALLHYKRGTLVVFFVRIRKKRGPVNQKLIALAEDFLIQNAVARNENLENVRGTELEEWSIGGVLRSKGKPSTDARTLKKMMGL